MVEDHQEDQSPLLKETECPVCLQVDHGGTGGAGHRNGNGVLVVFFWCLNERSLISDF